MARRCLAPINLFYLFVLSLVFGAWFSDSPLPLKPSLAKEIKFESEILEDPSTLGIDMSQLTPGGKCNIEFINDQLMGTSIHSINADEIFTLRGWVLDDQKMRLPRMVVARFLGSDNKESFITTQIGLFRSDVKDYFKLPESLVNSGFEFSSAAKNLPKGVYSLTLILPFDDVNYICDNERKIEVK